MAHVDLAATDEGHGGGGAGRAGEAGRGLGPVFCEVKVKSMLWLAETIAAFSR